jgi:hypothetical protein
MQITNLIYLFVLFPVTLALVFLTRMIEENALTTLMQKQNIKKNDENKFIHKEGEHVFNVRSFFRV